MSYVEHCDKHGQYHADYICGDCVEELKKERDALRAALEEILPYAEDTNDTGPWNAGWQSRELLAKINRVKNILGKFDDL